MFVKINGIPVNPATVALLAIEKSRRRKFHVQLYTVSGYNAPVSGELETAKEAEAARDMIAAQLSRAPADSPAEEIKAQLTEATGKLAELTDYTEQLEKAHEDLKAELAKPSKDKKTKN